MHVLIVEDNYELASLIQKTLELEEFTVDIATDGLLGLKMALTHSYDTILIDVKIPYINGFEICQQLRSRGLQMWIIMLSAADTVDDRVRGLQLGADDYLGKPFDFKELVARINAICRQW